MISAAWTVFSKGLFGQGLGDFLPRLVVALLIIAAIQWTAQLARRRWPELTER